VKNDTYTGPIRWGDEEVYWSDIFNSTKTENEYAKRLDRDYKGERYDRNKSKGLEWLIDEILNKNDEWDIVDHLFKCQFGEIKAIHILDDEEIEVELKNGEIIELEGGSNDIGARVVIIDEELGDVELKWDRIEKVEFISTPQNLKNKFGDPLFGTVETDYGEFTGFIQWDHDERLSTEELDGEDSEGDYSIQFGKIKSIEKYRRGSKVILKSGREMYLTGTNDVDDDNNGIIVSIPDFGRVDIEWEDFNSVRFKDCPEDAVIDYTSYGAPKYLKGTALTEDGKSFSGRIVFDMDETWDLEMLDGNDNDLVYLVPFKNVKKITPRNRNYSSVEFKNGTKLDLEETQDVSKKNDGILVFTGKREFEYISWKDLESVVFE